VDVNEHTCVRRFKITSGMALDTSSLLLSSPIKMGDVVGRGAPGLVMKEGVDRKELEMAGRVVVGIEEEEVLVRVLVLVLVGGRLEE